MHKYELLRLRADEYRKVLEEYAQKDPDVADFLQRWMPWYVRIQRREIRLPCYDYKLGVYFTNPDLSPLAERYTHASPNRLSDATSAFYSAIYDRLSDPLCVSRLRELGELPDLIPDTAPPPEEEAPLTPPIVKPGFSSLKRLLKRWF